MLAKGKNANDCVRFYYFWPVRELFSRYLCLFMAFYLLNCSVDAPDVSSRWKSENLKHNEQESVVELIIEKALDLGDVIPEYDDTDTDEASPKKSFCVDFFVLPDASSAELALQKILTTEGSTHKTLNPQEIHTLISPPPEA